VFPIVDDGSGEDSAPDDRPPETGGEGPQADPGGENV
jgi:hypothetical protein